ncbi:MAG: Na+/H+ antiporter NhaC family protein [Planctomycetes bacterium]|nr:Na+/H+ antiporter NhaC family protein [Planctomycetota bacterium]
MRRILLALLSVLLLASTMLLPQADPARLAALDAYTVLSEKVGPAPADGLPDTRKTLGQIVLEGPAMVERGERDAKLSLFGVRFGTTGESEDLTVHELARRSLIRGLREIASSEEFGLSLAIDGERTPTKLGQTQGANFLVALDGDKLHVEYTHPAGQSALATRNGWQPAQRSSLWPPLVAIVLAIAFRKPVLALFAGVWCGALLLELKSGASWAGAALWSLPGVVTKGLLPQVYDNAAGEWNSSKLMIIGFVVAMLSMVGVMTKSGGIRGLVDAVARLATGVRTTQIATWIMGLVVFFDDYANCILVGTTMRPLTDRFRISREKLSYLVDSTAAPVAGISLFSTWIAYEVSTFAPQLPSAGMSVDDGYAVFLATLPYRFYCIFTLVFAGLIVFSGRDFGPMLSAERRARATGKVVRDGGQPMVGDEATNIEPVAGVIPKAHRAVLPVLTFVAVTLEEIVRVGLGAHPGILDDASLSFSRQVTTILADGDSTRAILIGSTSGFVVASVLALLAGVASSIPRAIALTLKNMGVAIAILYFAWAIGDACGALGTAPYLTELLGDRLAPAALPSLLFLLSAGISFATGTSWGTMSILLPLVVGLAYSLGEQTGLQGDSVPIGGQLLMLMSIGAVLEGSIFGDHCSPISDTTILSSTASAADHVDHTRTQMVYALTTMAVALSLGYFPCAFMGWSATTALLAGCGALLMIVFVFGRKSTVPPQG